MEHWENYKKWILIGSILGFLVTVLIIFWGDARSIGGLILSLSPLLLFWLTCLSLLDYYFRFLRWNYLLRSLGIDLESRDSWVSFLSGLSFSVTPGNLGEAVKCFLLEKKGIPVSKTLPVVFGERLSDGTGIAIMASFGAIQFHYGWTAIVAIFVILTGSLFLVSQEWLFLRLVNFLRKSVRLKRWALPMVSFYRSVRVVFSARRLSVAILFSSCSALCQSIALFVLLKGMGVSLIFSRALFYVNISSIVGGVSLSPGGIVVVEGSLLALMVSQGVPTQAAASGVLISRFFNLWLGFLIGLFALRWVMSHWILEKEPKVDIIPKNAGRKA